LYILFVGIVEILIFLILVKIHLINSYLIDYQLFSTHGGGYLEKTLFAKSLFFWYLLPIFASRKQSLWKRWLFSCRQSAKQDATPAGRNHPDRSVPRSGGAVPYSPFGAGKWGFLTENWDSDSSKLTLSKPFLTISHRNVFSFRRLCLYLRKFSETV